MRRIDWTHRLDAVRGARPRAKAPMAKVVADYFSGPVPLPEVDGSSER